MILWAIFQNYLLCYQPQIPAQGMQILSVLSNSDQKQEKYIKLSSLYYLKTHKYVVFFFPSLFYLHFSFCSLQTNLMLRKKISRPRPWKVIPVKDKLLSLHPLSLSKIIFSQLQNSPQWAVVHLTKLPTHNSVQFHAIVCLSS